MAAAEKYPFGLRWASLRTFMRNLNSAVHPLKKKMRLDPLLGPRNPAIVQRGVGQLPSQFVKIFYSRH